MRLAVGRKAICALLGNLSWTTVKKWIRQHGLPVVQIKGMPPTLLDEHLLAWQTDRLNGRDRSQVVPNQGLKRPIKGG
jgi:hypothetical protein